MDNEDDCEIKTKPVDVVMFCDRNKLTMYSDSFNGCAHLTLEQAIEFARVLTEAIGMCKAMETMPTKEYRMHRDECLYETELYFTT